MLSVNKYPQEYIDACRARVNGQVSSYRNLVKVAKSASAASKRAPLESAVSAFEPVFFNNLVILLDSYFVHRSRTMELKDGNPLNEVRVICNSIMQNENVLAADKQIRLNPAKSVLKLEVGDEIAVTEAEFSRLSEAFFTEIERKYS